VVSTCLLTSVPTHPAGILKFVERAIPSLSDDALTHFSTGVTAAPTDSATEVKAKITIATTTIFINPSFFLILLYLFFFSPSKAIIV
jgi:hypothetical protein